MRDETPTARPGDDEEPARRGGAGAEGGDSPAADVPPGAPADDSSALGDTDQHSSADA